jgi:hypothetical protein
MKPEVLHLSSHCTVTTDTDTNGRWFITLSNGSTRFFRCPIAARKHLKLPLGIPSRSSYDAWIESLKAADAERASKRAGAQTPTGASDLPIAEPQHKEDYVVAQATDTSVPLTSEAPIQQAASSLSQEHLATGFGPECHADEIDPTANTRMVI